MQSVAPIQHALGHVFRDESLLRTALTHRSHGTPNNERLEFLGDGVVNCIVALALYERYPGLSEGELSRLRASLVSEPALAAMAESLDLGAHLRLGAGEIKSGGGHRPSILADTLEALMGAVLLDGGFDAARAAVYRVFARALASAGPLSADKDPKTRLQEYLQHRRQALPRYNVVAVRGLSHAQEFEVECVIGAIRCTGRGSSRRRAEQEAARLAYDEVTRA